MSGPSDPTDLAAREIHETLSRHAGARRRIGGEAVSSAASMAARRARWLGGGTGNLARGAVEGAARAAADIGGETVGFVRDAVIGVVEGTSQVVNITTPAIREVVVGAVRGANRVDADVTVASQDAVDGAIVSAASVGIDSAEAAVAAVDGAVEAVVESGGELRDAARASIGGVISGVSTAGGDVAAAVRGSAVTLVSHAAMEDGSGNQAAQVAGDVVATVLAESIGSADPDDELAELVSAAALGAVNTAYLAGPSHGNRVREEVLLQIRHPGLNLSPELRRQLAGVSENLSRELPRVHGAWRWSAVALGVRFLLRAGASDQAASLAFFTVLSFFPLMALAVIVFGIFGDPSAVRPIFQDLVTYYLPASSDIVDGAVAGLLANSTPLGFIALGGLIISANGLFMAANRSVNRVFGVASHKTLRGNLLEALTSGGLGIALMVSVGGSAFVQVALGLADGNPHSDGDTSHVIHLALGIAAAIVPAAVTGLAFTVLYHNLPDLEVDWKDAAFGGVIALLLFEAGKHLFFWVSGLAAHRVVVYGPVASTIVLLMWTYLAGLVFLYGAGLVRAAGVLRPKPFAPTPDPLKSDREEN